MASELRGSRRLQAEQDSAGGLRGTNEPKGIVGWTSAEGPNAAERDAEGDLRGGDEREEGDGRKREGGERSERRHGDGALKFIFQSILNKRVVGTKIGEQG
jgi:hypothetical protein